jgi:hypothetical protein
MWGTELFWGKFEGGFPPFVEQGAWVTDHGHGDFSIRRGMISER